MARSRWRKTIVPTSVRRKVPSTHFASVDGGRNQPCPCQSGRKFKRCCGPRATAI
ncbi:MAG: SEC-C metal-binding domain-containing protein [Polyangia bacterium]